jgi:beta-lactamase class A
VTNVSVYLRDLQFGPWMGIGEQEEFSAASLLKVPVMLAVLKQAETHPEILGQRVEVTKELAENFEQEFKPSHHVEVDGIYTVDELLQYMIVNSYNNAKTALDAFLQIYKPDDVLLMNTMDDLGFTGVYRSLNDALTVKQVASLFRLLYNSSYLNKQMSQKALDLLLASEFRSGIVAGVPPGIPVAHKFGEREEDTGVKQLHDCGIVYHPRDHYLLCIMTLGKDEQKLASVIADISRLIYAEIDDRSVQQ